MNKASGILSKMSLGRVIVQKASWIPPEVHLQQQDERMAPVTSSFLRRDKCPPGTIEHLNVLSQVHSLKRSIDVPVVELIKGMRTSKTKRCLGLLVRIDDRPKT